MHRLLRCRHRRKKRLTALCVQDARIPKHAPERRRTLFKPNPDRSPSVTPVNKPQTLFYHYTPGFEERQAPHPEKTRISAIPLSFHRHLRRVNCVFSQKSPFSAAQQTANDGSEMHVFAPVVAGTYARLPTAATTYAWPIPRLRSGHTQKTAGNSLRIADRRSGAAYEARTRYLHLGKVALYQMS